MGSHVHVAHAKVRCQGHLAIHVLRSKSATVSIAIDSLQHHHHSWLAERKRACHPLDLSNPMDATLPNCPEAHS